MRDYKVYIYQAMEACRTAFLDGSIYKSQAIRDQHVKNLRKFIDNDAATMQEELELDDLIQLIHEISLNVSVHAPLVCMPSPPFLSRGEREFKVRSVNAYA